MTSSLFCPVCPNGPELRPLDPHLLPLPLRRCDSCLGLLADPSTVAAAATHYHSSHYVMREGHGRHHCRSCGALFDAVLQRCRTCRKEQSIACVRCLEPMQVIEVARVAIDVCRPCRIVWFDRGELGLLTRRHSAALHAGLGSHAGLRASALDASAFEIVDAVPTGLEAARVTADTVVGAVTDASGSGVAEVLVSVGEGAVEVTSGALDVLAGILGAIDF